MCQRCQNSCRLLRDVGRVEVLRELVAEERRAADGDVAVAGEVGVDLDGVRVDGEQHLERGEALRRGEDAVDDRLREVVADDDLLREPGRDAPEAPRLHRGVGAGPAASCGSIWRGRHDGPGDEVREEADEEQVVEYRSRRLELAAPDVDRVAHRLEREERDAEGQDEAQMRDAHVRAQRREERARATRRRSSST